MRTAPQNICIAWSYIHIYIHTYLTFVYHLSTRLAILKCSIVPEIPYITNVLASSFHLNLGKSHSIILNASTPLLSSPLYDQCLDPNELTPGWLLGRTQ